MLSPFTIIGIILSMYAVAAMTFVLLTRIVVHYKAKNLSQDEKDAYLALPAAKGTSGSQIGSFIQTIILGVLGVVILVGQASVTGSSGGGTSDLGALFGLEILALFILLPTTIVVIITNGFWIYSKKNHFAEQVAIVTGNAPMRIYSQHTASWIMWVIATGVMIYLTYNGVHQDVAHQVYLDSIK